MGKSCTAQDQLAAGDGMAPAASRHPGGVNVLMCDGSAQFVTASIDHAVWFAYGTIAGGETVTPVAAKD